ncbi:MAG: hypothetical protein LPJ89_05115, partial [Hymenobacteraceae bacterium]|nr:hypothetical protein [Hymenobacteraceae bacterium]MDX5397849.1 hypothetical protein [Hymenobacteraceae bacterium]MDX5443147.1 hypothetical protein [Hymenobacteraceae bacterium]MDX5513920.1 hypothetical protein [Hymenobacteraceae bacterium]
ELLKKVVQDNANCPQCSKNALLKHTGTATNESGWQVNTYKCRKCNINFNWNRPNNPWDMLRFLEAYSFELEQVLEKQELPEAQLDQMNTVVAQLHDNINKLRPVLEGSDAEFETLLQKEKEMEQLIRQFKTYLQIEKIKMESMEEETEN